MKFINFSRYRARHHWQTILTLILGVILATGLLASGPLLINTVMDFALPHKLRNVSPLDSNIRLTTHDSLDYFEYQELDRLIRNTIEEHIGPYTDQVISTAGSTWAYPWYMEQLLTDQRVNLRFYDEIEEQVEFLDGGWPEGEIYQDNEIAVVISEPFSDAYELKVGDRLPVSVNAQSEQPSAWFVISGIAHPKSYLDIYWFGEFNPLRDQADQRWTAQYSAIVPREAIFPIHKALSPISRLELNWHIILDHSAIKVEEVNYMLNQVAELRAALDSLPQHINLATHLDLILTEFISQAQVVRVTLYVLIGEVLFLTLYYLVMITTLSAQQMEGEFSTFSSRGASFAQIFGIQSVEAFSIGILALVCAPLVAIFVVWGLAKVGPMAGVSQTDWGYQIPFASWLAAGIGVAASILSLLLPVRPAVKRGIVAHTRASSRGDRSSWWQRFYLDVFILILGLVLLWRLNLYGGLAAGSGARIDWLLLLSPLLLLVGSATILLRIFPWLLRFIEQLLTKSRGLLAILAIWQTSRNPAHISRLVLLLTLAMSLGVLSTGLSASLDKSEYERARYIAGSQLRLSFDHYSPKSRAGNNSDFTWLQASSTIWRGTGSASIRTYRTYPTFEVMAIEPYEFVNVAEFRPDFSEQSMGQLLGHLVTGPEQIPDKLLPLPGEPSDMGVWVLEKPSFGNDWELDAIDYLYLRAKMQTAQGDFFLVNLDLIPLSSQETLTESATDEQNNESIWRYFNGNLPEFPAEAYPLSLHSFWFSMRPMGDETRYRVSMIVDDFSTTDRETGEEAIFEDFESIEHIWTFNHPEHALHYSKRNETHSGVGSLSLEIPGTPNPQGLALLLAGKLGSEPLPALVSEEFMQMTQVNTGDVILANLKGIQTPVEIRGVVRNFPTLFDEVDHGFIITARSPLIFLLNRKISLAINANELWIETDTPPTNTELVDLFPDAVQIRQMNEERQAIRAEPLLLGLRSVTYLGYLITAILSLVGFATYFYLSARQREVTYGVLRSLGLSPKQLYGSLLLEQAVTIISGLTLGTVLGLLLNSLVLPGLPVSTGGHPPIPPFQVYQDWSAIVVLYLFLLSSFMVLVGIVTALLWRTRIHRVLRIGQE